MPKKYQIHPKPAPPIFEPIARLTAIEVEGCLGCLQCVKRSSCVFRVYDHRHFNAVQVIDTCDTECVNCMRCVQECKKNIIGRVINPRYLAMGDSYWTPSMIESIWKMAASGKIPVSGAGYRGPFCGPGFDQMWTDMSEIVRPTRDGIHGREYISTVVELGRKPSHLAFDDKGRLAVDMPPCLEIPLPIILGSPERKLIHDDALEAIVQAAKDTGTLAIVDFPDATGLVGHQAGSLIVRFDPLTDSLEELGDVAGILVPDGEEVLDAIAAIKRWKPSVVTGVKVRLDEHAADRSLFLAGHGAEILYLQADHRGNGFGAETDVFVTRLMRRVHMKLVEASVRGEVSILVSGGIGMAEHVAKIVICGADAVVVDTALRAAMESRLENDAVDGFVDPPQSGKLPAAHAAQRIVNLLAAWHAQLLEVMGAMGMREVRRLRGEVGRAMFFEDLEKGHFAPIFGERRADAAPAEADYPGAAIDWVYPASGTKADHCPSRFRNPFGKFRVTRSSACIACGKCADICAYGVHVMAGGRLLAPRSAKCRGADHCRNLGRFCGDLCPTEAIRVGDDPSFQTFGDPRWPAELIVATWSEAETGRPPENGLEYRVGKSGGGFDRIDIQFPKTMDRADFSPSEVDLSVPLNRRTDDNRPRLTIGFPVYGGGMSFGSVSLTTMVSRAMAYKAFGSFTCTGEGGYPEVLKPYRDNVITQVATGLFGVREETIQWAPIVEFKYAQGAKPGLGGHLLGDKVTPAVAKMREAVEGNALFSPFPFHSVYSVEDHKKHIDWIKAVNERALISVKVSTPTDVDMVAVGSYYAGAHIVHIDGSYGGTGAAPDIAKKNIAMPIEYAIPKVHQFLKNEGVRDQITLIASGGIRTAWDIAKAIALGADGVVIGTAEMIALECIRCAACESGRGCPRGIATTDPELSTMYSTDYASQRLINLFHSFAVQLQDILWRLGMRSVRELVGRSDVLVHRDYGKR
ncbi:glutamate synthase-related protein [Desulfatirhabdium butyrativorans]|uniref:glutamate synthase-related protein n=1 Tax=Desulfatirhabdium butyrativorans TaxID=340467 RepID=UPI000408FF46|nr:glutamate synthase-related protein [Desulfatirhabdium butyrativorans]